jgi:hypothetical protein
MASMEVGNNLAQKFRNVFPEDHPLHRNSVLAMPVAAIDLTRVGASDDTNEKFHAVMQAEKIEHGYQIFMLHRSELVQMLNPIPQAMEAVTTYMDQQHNVPENFLYSKDPIYRGFDVLREVGLAAQGKPPEVKRPINLGKGYITTLSGEAFAVRNPNEMTIDEKNLVVDAPKSDPSPT